MLFRSADARAARALRLDELRMWRDDVAQAALSVLATRWPDRFAESHERRRDANAMFRELAVIHDESLHTPATPRPGTDGEADR